jgi:hypothetical protein
MMRFKKMNTMSRGGRIFMWVVLGALALAAFGWVTQLLWNWIVPALFAGPAISFWQAMGLLALSKILFSGLGRKGWRHGHAGHVASWKYRWYEKYSHMKPEEREAFKKRMMDKWCPSHSRREAGNSEKAID